MIQAHEPAQVDFISNGRGFGAVADKLLDHDMDTGILRPWVDEKGRTCVALYNQQTKKRETKVLSYKHPLATNTSSSMMYDTWKLWDETVLRAARLDLQVWGDIYGTPGLALNIPNAMDYMVLMHQTVTDAGLAKVSMNPLSQTNRDRPEFGLDGTPLPLIHHDFSFDFRERRVMAKQKLPADTVMLENSVHQVAVMAEKLILGKVTGPTYAGYRLYGLTDYPYRITKTFTLPTAAGWTPKKFKDEILAAIQSARDVLFNGPYGVWLSPGWWQYMNNDYSAANPQGGSLMKNLQEMKEVKFWNSADYLDNFQVLIVDLRPTVVQALQGLKMQVVQWSSGDNMEQFWKVLAMMQGRVRRNSDGNTGVVHCTAA